MLGIGRTSAYNLVKENHFKVVKIGASIRILKKSFDDWLRIKKRSAVPKQC